MSDVRTIGLAVLVLLGGGCAPRRHAPIPSTPPDMSGFLDDYSRLRPGAPGEALLVYRNPDARWNAYDKVLFEPVAVWRSGRGSLDRVPEADLLRLAADLERAVERRLGTDWQLVDKPGPGVLRIRLAITEARASDPILDILTTAVPAARDAPTDDGPVGPETLAFIEAAAVEGEITDAETGVILAQGVDRRAGRGPIGELTWGEVNRLFTAWADRVCSRLERARRGELR